MDIIKKVNAWVVKVGVNVAYVDLVRAGMSPSMAYKLVYGGYKHSPKQMTINTINKAMKE
jgi:ketol-acid reductoisomerase